MTAQLTMSGLPRALNCAGSLVLARAETFSPDANAGHDEHEVLSALAELPPDLARYVPADARSEIKVAYDVSTGVGRIIGEGVGRGYGALGPFEIPGSIDVLGIEGDAVIVLDWKTGHSDVEPAATNGQLWGYALAACRALGKSRAVIRIVYTKTGRLDEYEADEIELAMFADRLAELHAQIATLRARKRDAEPVSTREGSWCRYCPSKHVCPSKNALLVQIGSGGAVAVADTAMSPERAVAAYEQVVRIEQLVKDARARLEAYVTENGPIDLGNGKAFGRYVREGKRKLDGRVALQVIRETVGESAKEFEAEAVTVQVTQAGLKRAVEKLEGARGAAKRVEAMVKRMELLGGVKRETEYPIGEYATAKHAAAEPMDLTDVDRMLREAG